MAISHSHEKKSPSQNPVEFYKLKQQGGTHGKPSVVGAKLSGGPMREKLMGDKQLGGKMNPTGDKKRSLT